MATVPFDTYEIIQGLKQAGIPETHAKAIAESIKKVDLEHVVTKQDLREELFRLKAELLTWILPLLVGQAAVFAAIVKWL